MESQISKDKKTLERQAKQNQKTKPVVKHPPPEFAKKDAEQPEAKVKEAPKIAQKNETAKEAVAEVPKEAPAQVPTVVAKAANPGT